MTIHTDVPLFENTDDNTHCVQASYKMVLKHFMPELEFSWDELDRVSAKQPGMWTWPMAGLCWLSEQGFEIVYVEAFDYDAFLEREYDYLVERYGEAIAVEQAKHSDIQSELPWVQKFLETVDVQDRTPELAEIFTYLDRGFLVIVSVNSASLNDREGYVSHSIVVTGYDDSTIYLNDPGQPGRKDWGISYEQFKKGWSYPDASSNNITALRLR